MELASPSVCGIVALSSARTAQLKTTQLSAAQLNSAQLNAGITPRKTHCGIVFTFKVLAQQKTGVGGRPFEGSTQGRLIAALRVDPVSISRVESCILIDAPSRIQK